jgi:hypothetical protein
VLHRLFARLTSRRHQFDQWSPGAQLDQSIVHTPLNGAARGVAIEIKHPFKVNDMQHEMIDSVDMEHGWQHGRVSKIAECPLFLPRLRAPVLPV